MTALRFLSVTLLCALLLSPFLKTFEQTVQDPIIILAEDNSSSITDQMSTEDSARYRTAIEAMATALSGSYDVRRLRFGETVDEDAAVDFSHLHLPQIRLPLDLESERMPPYL